MKIKTFVHQICPKCGSIRRHRRIRVICSNSRQTKTEVRPLKF